MLTVLKEWFIRITAVIVPALALSGVYALLVRNYYLDSSVHRKLLLANAPVQSHFEHLRRKWGFHPDRALASQPPGEVVRGARPSRSGRTKIVPAAAPELDVPIDDSKILVEAPRQSLLDRLTKKYPTCAGLGEFELLTPGAPIAPQVKLSASERGQLIEYFENAKKTLLGWLLTQEKLLAPDLFVFMRERIATTGMKLPPVDFEPDLELRAAVVWTKDPGGVPTLAVGSKFLKLLTSDPQRAQFEFTRAMAQGWSPCEFNQHPWAEVLTCFGLSNTAACEPGVFSEGGWATSSLLATYLSFPNCRLAAFESQAISRCVTRLKLPIEATDQWVQKALWKVGQ